MTERVPAPPPYGTVVFDCDSTLSAMEGIEELCGERRAEIKELTDRAMRGELPLEAVYGERLRRIRPSADDVVRIGALYVEHVLPHAAELVAALRALGKRVAIVSGGLLQPVRHLARALGVDEHEVDAVAVLHDASGAYAGFDEDSPLARAGGKLEVVRELSLGDGARPPVVLVGDGATDLEAAPACARFVAFAGVERRPAVLAAADAVCESADLAALLPLLCTAGELEQLAADPLHAPLVRAAESLTP